MTYRHEQGPPTIDNDPAERERQAPPGFFGKIKQAIVYVFTMTGLSALGLFFGVIFSFFAAAASIILGLWLGMVLGREIARAIVFGRSPRMQVVWGQVNRFRQRPPE